MVVVEVRGELWHTETGVVLGQLVVGAHQDRFLVADVVRRSGYHAVVTPDGLQRQVRVEAVLRLFDVDLVQLLWWEARQRLVRTGAAFARQRVHLRRRVEGSHRLPDG